MELMPFLQPFLLILDNEPLQPGQFVSSEVVVVRYIDRRQPELCNGVVPLDMYVWWLVTFVAVEEHAIRSDLRDRGPACSRHLGRV
jgi:hypothetical protein